MLYKRKHSIPSNPELWKKAEAEAKKRFRRYPSSYSSVWAETWYKNHGGTWQKDDDSKKNQSVQPSTTNQRMPLSEFEQYVDDDDDTPKIEHPSKEIEKDKSYRWLREPLVDISRPVIDEAGTVIGFHPVGSNTKDVERSKEGYRTSYPKILPRSVAMRLNAIERENLLRRSKAHQLAMQQMEEMGENQYEEE